MPCTGYILGFLAEHCRSLLLCAQLLSITPTHLEFGGHSRPSLSPGTLGELPTSSEPQFPYMLMVLMRIPPCTPQRWM